MERGPGSKGSAQLWTPARGSPAPASTPLCSLLPLEPACCSLVSRTPPALGPSDGVLSRTTTKFIRCQALYIPHNSVSQALLCMCLIFTVTKTNGESDSPDTLEGWALARPQRNLGMNSISDLRLYFMYNTPVVFKFP